MDTAKWKSICCELMVLGEREWAAGSELHEQPVLTGWAFFSLSQWLPVVLDLLLSPVTSTQRCSWKCLRPRSASGFLSLMSVFLSGINFSEAIQCFNHPSHYCVLVDMIMDSLLISEHLEVLLGHLTLNCLRLFSFHTFQCFHISTPQHVHFDETDKQSLCLY